MPVVDFSNPNAVNNLYTGAKAFRSAHESDWRMASAYCLPRHYESWQTQSGPATYGTRNGKAARRFAYDTTGIRSLPKYAAVLERMATPQSMRWHTLQSDNTDLNKLRPVSLFFDQLTDVLFKQRYNPKANFVASYAEVYNSIGVYGTGPVFIGRRRRRATDNGIGLGYKAHPLRDVFIVIDDDGNAVTIFRRFWVNARQFKTKWPDVEIAPKSIAAELGKPEPSEETTFEIVHVIFEKDEDKVDPEAIDNRRFPIGSRYLVVQDKEFVNEPEGGYTSMPLLTPRTFTEAGDPYGYSPAIQALPALGSASAVKKSYLKQGQRATDQVILAHDDGMLNGRVNLTPGHVHPGAVNAQGQKLIHALEPGNFQIAENILGDERKDVEDSFFVTLFQILTENPEMTATEVIERSAEKASLFAPTMGRLQGELLGPGIEREVDLLQSQGLLPELPPELIEAQGEYDIVYTSPLAKGQFSEEIGGFLRTLEISANAAAATNDPSKLDYYNFDEALPEIADHLAVPSRWMNGEETIKALREGRQAQQEQQQLLEAAPALAGVAKAAE